MKLHTETIGNGPDLVMLHGWGLHGGLFDGIAESLAGAYRVTRIDLPGHGRSRDSVLPGDVNAWAGAVLEVVPPRAVWLGWSLGGLVAQAAALCAPQRLRGLLLVNTTPRFVAAPDWPPAQAPEVLARFVDELHTDYRATVQQFLALQVPAGAPGRGLLRELRRRVFAHGEPHPVGLAAGVAILRDTDLRARLPEIRMPACVIAGRLDRLTPPQAGRWLAGRLPAGEFHCFARAAHAPFLSHPVAFAARARQFLEALDDEPGNRHATG